MEIQVKRGLFGNRQLLANLKMFGSNIFHIKFLYCKKYLGGWVGGWVGWLVGVKKCLKDLYPKTYFTSKFYIVKSTWVGGWVGGCQSCFKDLYPK